MNVINVWMAGASKVASPAKVMSSSDWYLLNHVVGKLIQFDHSENHFVPMLAREWAIEGNRYTFKLRKDIHFSDGTPMDAASVAASIKFLIQQRSSTHFPVWEFFADCEKLNSFRDKCLGIEIIDSETITFTLKQKMQSFFLLLASPEGGIWKLEDLDRFSNGESPKAFSGLYIPNGVDVDTLTLVKNDAFRPANFFPERPAQLRIHFTDLEKTKTKFKDGKIDIYFEAGRPFGDYSFEPPDFQVNYSAPSTVLYLFRVGRNERAVDSRLIESMWSGDSQEMTPAQSFLPFTTRKGIGKDQFLECLPKVSEGNRKLKIAVLYPYFSDELLEFLRKRAYAANYTIEFAKLDSEQWFEAFNHLDGDRYDFILSAYVASERFPSVQLRYLLESNSVPFDLSRLDDPHWGAEQTSLLLDIEKYILKKQLVVPLYFVRNQIRHGANIDIGDQPLMDAEIQLWRVRKK